MPCRGASNDNPPPTYSIREASRLLNVSRFRIEKMIFYGQLQTTSCGRFPKITRASIRKFLATTLADEAPAA